MPRLETAARLRHIRTRPYAPDEADTGAHDIRTHRFSMINRHPSISELLSGQADVLHSKWRFNMQKRIVELNQ
ncbi:MAG TPA: hypothetical protein VLZ56_05690, partial [Mycoplana sp.]|nr:hypothetical protein [Mycoplana sp.]